MICIHHYNLMLSIFSTLKILCALPIHLTLSLNHWQPLVFLLSPWFCLFLSVISLELQCEASSDWLFHLVTGIYVSSMSLQGLLAHFFLMLSNIPLSGCGTVYLSIHPLEGILGTLKFWQLWIKLLQIPVCRCCVHVVYNSSGSVPRRTVAELYGKSMFSFTRKPPDHPPKWPRHFAFPPAANEFLLLHSLTSIRWCLFQIWAILIGI